MIFNNQNTITAIGTGTSTGIPIIGCLCKVCTSPDHRDQRLRTSIYVETRKGKKFLVDTTPDLRTQFLNNKISELDFVLITHEHADHLHGIDDLRPFGFKNRHQSIPIYTTSATRKIIENRFDYIFKKHSTAGPTGGGIPRLHLNEVSINQKLMLEGEEFYFFTYPHGHCETMGFIHEQMAYIVDCHNLNDKILEELKERKLKLLILDCVQNAPHSTHLCVSKTFEYIKKIKPAKTGLIHMGHDLGHQALLNIAKKEFGDQVFPLYDQQKLFY